MNLAEYDISNPFQATVIKSERITDDTTAEVRHIVLEIDDAAFHYIEGQSVGVLAPGPHDFGNKHHLRLYSIASSRQGEGHNASEISLCVRRCHYIDEVSGERYPGIASNFLCDRRPGDTIEMTGPYGRAFMPPRNPQANLLMIGIGTGIAPFRAFIKHIYDEREAWKGKVRLFYGARSGMDLLYMNNKNNDLSLYYDEDTFKAFEALSPRPHFDEPAQLDRAIKDNVDEAWALINDPKTHIYISGLSQLEESLDKVFSELAGSAEIWQSMKKTIAGEGRWSTLFYE